MTVTLVFLALLMAVFAGGLFWQSVNVKPWIAESATGEQARKAPSVFTAPRVGLAVFIAVATSVFALTISAYTMRMDMGTDWRSLPEPNLLWLNTGILLLASIGLQWAWRAAKRGRRQALTLGLAAGGVGAVAFIIGQYLVWGQLVTAGYYASGNPATAFFFLLTALHALHLLGGLIAWARTLLRFRRGATPTQIRESVALCALYWHYLLLVWVVLFALLLST